MVWLVRLALENIKLVKIQQMHRLAGQEITSVVLHVCT